MSKYVYNSEYVFIFCMETDRYAKKFRENIRKHFSLCFNSLYIEKKSSNTKTKNSEEKTLFNIWSNNNSTQKPKFFSDIVPKNQNYISYRVVEASNLVSKYNRWAVYVQLVKSCRAFVDNTICSIWPGRYIQIKLA